MQQTICKKTFTTEFTEHTEIFYKKRRVFSVISVGSVVKMAGSFFAIISNIPF